jgi:7,8-dihydropterin-6-yl-methyl-4-(beta-D-ribofuranosyl)aminobenzene 5'-phosphate synthase
LEEAMNFASKLFLAGLVVLLSGGLTLRAAATPASPRVRITVLYDAFGDAPGMQRDWGYSAFVEYGGKRILFDTGNDPGILARNAKVKGIDLSKLDFVVMSHRHADHMGGLSYVLSINPDVPIYAPKENFGIFGSEIPGTFYRKDPSLPAEQRYWGGTPPEMIEGGSAWAGANFKLIDKNTEIAPHIHLVTLISEKTGTLEMRELSLVLDTPDGLVIVVGCSHPGIDKIVESATAINPRVHFIAGGFHLVTTSDPDIDKIVATLHDRFKVEYIAPGHCTGEPAFAALKKAYGDHDIYAGLGTMLDSTTIGAAK